MTRMVALLRAVNVGGTRKVPMADLRELLTAEGFTDVATYIQSGNVVLSSKLGAAATAAAFEAAFARRFGFDAPVVVRTAAAWAPYAGDGPFPEARHDRPRLLHLGLAAGAMKPGVLEAVRAKAVAGEQVELVGDALWIDFPAGVAGSKITPAVLDRAAGAPVTLRNWNTVRKLQEMLAAPR
ncbi:MAG: DUF1697 domain-containing protein [Polyangiales bacterium]